MGSVIKIVSGGQTGADRAALDWALACGMDHGGWCPLGRRSESGPIPAAYQLRESPSSNFLQRTEWNVRDTDATVVFTLAPFPSGGSYRTLEFARAHGKPCLHLSHTRDADRSPDLLRQFIDRHQIKTLNVAGPRASKEPNIAAFVHQVLSAAVTVP